MDKHKTLALVVIAGSVTFLYQIATLLQKIQTWAVIWDPPNVAQMLLAAAGALIAIGAALGLNVTSLMQSFGKKE